MKNIFGSYHKKLEQRAFSISFYSSGLQDLEQRNEPGPSNGLFSIQYLSISTAYAQSFRWFNVGASVHYLSEEIYPYRSNGYAFNVGLSRSFAKDRIHIGTAVRSLGEMQRLDVKKTPLPKAWISGLSIGLLEWNGSKNPELPVFVRTHLDYVYPLNNESNLFMNHLKLQRGTNNLNTRKINRLTKKLFEIKDSNHDNTDAALTLKMNITHYLQVGDEGIQHGMEII